MKRDWSQITIMLSGTFLVILGAATVLFQVLGQANTPGGRLPPTIPPWAVTKFNGDGTASGTITCAMNGALVFQLQFQASENTAGNSLQILAMTVRRIS